MRKTILILCLFIGIALTLHLIQFNSSPPGFNADEAAYGYNAYSILKTGKDEYGRFLPLRLVSFGDYKLPLYSYLLIPFVAIGGLTPTMVRMPALISALALIPAGYLLAQALFNRRGVSLTVAFLFAVSPGIHFLSRHAHETIPASLLILCALILILHAYKKYRIVLLCIASLLLGASMFMYHSARIYAFVGLFSMLPLIWKNRRSLTWIYVVSIWVIIGGVSFYADSTMPPARIASLFIGTHEGIGLISQELRTQFAYSPFNLPYIVTLWEILRRYVSYLSPEFLMFYGDQNPRFGFPMIGLLSLVEYAAILAGFYFMLRNWKNYYWVFVLFVIAAPLPAALTWQEYSLNRSYLLLPLLITIGGYGTYTIASQFRYRSVLLATILILHCVFIARTWEFIYFHYPTRATVIRSWEAGYKEAMHYVYEKRDNYDEVYVTAKDGQPYMQYLFWNKITPAVIQKQSERTKPDIYGFTQVKTLDGIYFQDVPLKHGTILIVAADTQEVPSCARHLKDITQRSETLFRIYEAGRGC